MCSKCKSDPGTQSPAFWFSDRKSDGNGQKVQKENFKDFIGIVYYCDL